MPELSAFDVVLSSQLFASFLGNFVAAIIVLIATLVSSRLMKSWITRLGFKYEQFDDTLFVFLSKAAQVVILVVGGTFVLNSFGVQTTSIIALLGAAGLAVGLALQGTLSNFAAGIMLIIFRPFKCGDYIAFSTQSGTVKEITIFTTDLTTSENVQVIVPNGQVWGAPITNYSTFNIRRMDLTFRVSYSTNLSVAETLLQGLVDAEARIHKDPAPMINVSNLNQSSVDFIVRIWCDSSDLLTLRFDMNRKVKEALDIKGIEIPFPTTKIINTKG